MKKILSLIFLLLASHSFAGVDCDFNLSFSQVTAQVLETEQVLQNGINLYRGKDPFGVCASYRLYFGKGSAQTYQRRARSGIFSISYNLHNNINKIGILKEQPDALSNQEYVEMYGPDRFTNYQAPYFISIPDIFVQNYPPKGVYTDNVTVVVWVIKNQNYAFDGTANLAVTINVPTRLDIAIVDQGAPFDVSATNRVFDFGNIAQDQERSGDLVVRSNTPYSLRMTSQNGGLLKQGNSTIGYNLSVNTNSVNLSGSTPIQFATGSGTSGVSGDRYNLRVKITESTGSKVAGLYEDVITITAIAN